MGVKLGLSPKRKNTDPGVWEQGAKENIYSRRGEITQVGD